MPEFDRFTLAVIDDIADREKASDGRSRYAAYLTKHADDFHEGGEPLTPVDFAALAWSVATFPVMWPGYVDVRPAGRPRPLDWERDPWGRHDDPWPVLVGPERADGPAVLVAATILLPVPEHILLRPTSARPGRTLTHEAKSVVAAIAAYANTHLSPLVDDLLGDVR
ncbi:hypothetical protein [Kitasatospora purpeofusca]|uniref:hypothetical protein n=1 Tax=Kitasatospora purpeofusca TaxID=67352 RepID=UPI0036AA00DC